MSIDAEFSATAAPVAASAGERADAGHVAALVAASGTSFYWAMKLLPVRRRQAMFAIYAFCRAVDDVVDQDATEADKRAGLAFWRQEVERARKGQGSGPIGRALGRAMAEFALAVEDLQTVIDGMEMDVGPPIQAPDLATLDRYCECVASAVGRLSIAAFGVPVAAGRPVAHHLGRALQLTNVLRDLAEDATLGRLYLPREILRQHGIAASDPATVLAHPNLPAVADALAAHAAAAFAAAFAAMRGCPARKIRPARVMAQVYVRQLRLMRRHGWRQPARPVSLGKAARLWIALRYGVF